MNTRRNSRISHDRTTFSHTEVKILEYGLRWIHKAGDSLTDKLAYLLSDPSVSINTFLQAVGCRSFKSNMIPYLTSVIADIGAHGRIVHSFKDHWPDLSYVLLPPLEPWESARIIETFLEVFSELAEDAWSPILEQTWRTALLAMLRTRSITNHIWPCSKNYTASLVFS